jgi:hypothetical protein
MWGRIETSDVKVILPGEMGMSSGGQIGTFAVGSGCRGYLVYDNDSAMGGWHMSTFQIKTLWQ